MQAHLTHSGVETLIHYPVPPHLSDAYRKTPAAQVAAPIANMLADSVLSLPMGPHLSTADQDIVIDALRSFRG